MAKRIARFLSAGLLAVLTACGGGGGGGGGSSAGGSSPPPTPPPAATPDTTPDAFQFQAIANAQRDTVVTSHRVTISGIDTPTSVSIENGEYSIDDGSFTSTAGSISAGQTLTVRARVSAVYSKVTRVRVTVGSVSANFEVAAEIPDFVPDSIAFDGQDVVYLLKNSLGLIFRWSIADERYLEAYAISANGQPMKMAYSSNHQRLYLGYSTGAIRYIDTTSANPSEVQFANTTLGVNSLVSVGNYVLAQDGSGAWGTHYVFDRNGVRTYQWDWYRYSREYAWDPATSRVYFFRDNITPNDLHYAVIDQATGQITAEGETPYHGSYLIEPPIRVSANGQYVLLGTGDVYNQAGLTWARSLGLQIADARWLTNGSLVTLSTANNQTTLRRLGTNFASVEQLTYSGQALRVVGTDAKMAVLVINNSSLQFHIYVPNDDGDNDGVTNTQDAFPLDPAASVDTDHDGYPDAWNAGRTQSDSTTGLSLDAYPQDAACYLASHGNGTTCNSGTTTPNYIPDQVVQHGDTIYLLSGANRRVYRWSLATESYLNPYVVGINQGVNTLAPTKMTYSSSHQRLYLGYANGAIRYIDVTSSNPIETPFTTIAMSVDGLAAVGNFVLAQDNSGAWATHYVFDSNGAITDQEEWNYYSREYAWDAVTSRVYFFGDSSSPTYLRYEVINQGTGQITAEGEAPYHGAYTIQPPIRVSANGQYVLTGSGNIYSQPALTWTGSLGSQVTDARWFADGSLATLITANNHTTLRRSSSNITLEQRTFSGQALRVVGTDAKMAVLVINNSSVRFHVYVPSSDSDGDGVTNTQDAFPLDPAASIDTDHDGHPDAWNAGRSQGDSTTGLSLDAYPQDSACYLPAHGNGTTCNYAAMVPSFAPNQIAQHGNTIYLLSSANRRVYRWSIATESYLNPYVVGIDQGFGTLAPTQMAFSSNHQRLYLGYSNGTIRYIDVTSGTPTEVPFTNTSTSVEGLMAVGDYVMAQDDSGSWETHYVINSGGVITNQTGWSHYSRAYAWDPVRSRVYFFRDGVSPNDLLYETIDQSTGQITTTGETPYHGAYNIEPPIRVSANGQRILLGTGDIYAQGDMTWSGSLGSQIIDARWFADGSLVALTTASDQTTLRRLSTTFTNLEQLTYSGQALRVVGSDTKMVVIVTNNGSVGFHVYVPSNDSDNDGVTNTQDAFPLDPAASVDTDHDGYPDTWNAGSNQGDSTTGLSLDTYPQDSACYLLSHGNGVSCNYSAAIPNYVPNQVINDGDTVYLLSSGNHRVYRWSIATGTYLNPYIVGIDQGFAKLAPTKMTYSSAHQRLYLGYSTGAIQYIDVTSGDSREVPFANTSMGVRGLVAAGNYVVAQDESGGWATHYVIDSTGVITDLEASNYDSSEYAWDPVTSRVYFFRDGLSPNDLHFEVIDQVAGTITAEGETPYHGGHSIEPPIRVSPDGQHVVLGSGTIYNQSGLASIGTLGPIKDVNWKDYVIVSVDTSDRVVIRDADTRAVLTSYQYLGYPIRMVFGQAEAYLVHVVNNTTAFVRLPFGDQDADSMPRWWEELYGLSDSTAADALGDLDADLASNAEEYLSNSNPIVADTDGDGLTDFEEISTYSTDPLRTDSDDDGLSDGDEVDTYHSDPMVVDTDGDHYTDFDEALYGGDPLDPAVLPQPITSLSESFENNPTLAAWSTPRDSSAQWTIDPTTSFTGSASLKSGAFGTRPSSVRLRAFFSAGQLSFRGRIGNQQCCDQLLLLIDGVQVLVVPKTNQWNQYSVPITLGVHDVEWQHFTSPSSPQSANEAWIDDVAFVAQ